MKDMIEKRSDIDDVNPNVKVIFEEQRKETAQSYKTDDEKAEEDKSVPIENDKQDEQNEENAKSDKEITLEA